MELTRRVREIGNSGSQVYGCAKLMLTLRIWNIIFLVRKLWPREINCFEVTELVNPLLWDFLNWLKVVVDWTVGICSMFWCLGLEGRQVISREVKGRRVLILEETPRGKKEQFSVSGLFYPEVLVASGTPAAPPGEHSGRGLLLLQLIQSPQSFYQQVNFSHGSDLPDTCSLSSALPYNRSSIVHFWKNCASLAEFGWIQGPFTYSDLLDPLILLWRH